MSKAFENEFFKNLGLLSKEQQRKVLAYIKTLLKTPPSSSHELLRFAGSIDKAEVDKMRAAIFYFINESLFSPEGAQCQYPWVQPMDIVHLAFHVP